MGWYEPLVFLAGVIMGTGSTITVKVIYGLEAIGVTGDYQKYEKPLFTTWVMFLGMTLALPVHFAMVAHRRRHRVSRVKSLTESAEEAEMLDVPWRTYFLLVIPACFDLLGTALSGVGLLFTTVSVYQLVRCSVIIVTALLKATVLKHRLTNYMWTGIFINTVAMILVSATSFVPGATGGEEGENRDPRIGIAFILLSCIVQGSQYVFEEKVMTVDNAPPLVVVGMEGLWGALLMPLVVFPWAYILPGSDAGGCIENFWDSIVMLQNSSSIQLVLFSFTVTVFLYNIFCIYVTFLLSSIWHAILDNFRPVSVWATDLLLFYVFTKGTFGEEWTRWSWLELAGMLLLFYGTAVYNGTVQLPWFDYSEAAAHAEHEEEEEDDQLLHAASPDLRPNFISSPNLTRSPLLNRGLRKIEHSVSSRATAEYHPIHTINLNDYGSNNEQGFRGTNKK